jgi:hypothetical protein
MKLLPSRRNRIPNTMTTEMCSKGSEFRGERSRAGDDSLFYMWLSPLGLRWLLQPARGSKGDKQLSESHSGYIGCQTIWHGGRRGGKHQGSWPAVCPEQPGSRKGSTTKRMVGEELVLLQLLPCHFQPLSPLHLEGLKGTDARQHGCEHRHGADRPAWHCSPLQRQDPRERLLFQAPHLASEMNTPPA